MSKSEFSASILLAGLSAAILIASTRMAYSTNFGPGPGFFPFWASVVMLVSSLYQAIAQLRRSASRSSGKGLEWPSAQGARRILAIFAGIVVAAALSGPLGLRLTLLLLLAYLVLAVERQSIRRSLAVLLVVPTGFWLLFDMLLELQLPAGIFGI